jgi:transposase
MVARGSPSRKQRPATIVTIVWLCTGWQERASRRYPSGSYPTRHLTLVVGRVLCAHCLHRGRHSIVVHLDRTSLSANTGGLRGARHLIEHFFCKLKHFRAIATRDDKTARNVLAAVPSTWPGPPSSSTEDVR